MTLSADDGERELLANLMPLGYTERDRYRDAYEAADAILAAGFHLGRVSPSAADLSRTIREHALFEDGWCSTCKKKFLDAEGRGDSAAHQGSVVAALVSSLPTVEQVWSDTLGQAADDVEASWPDGQPSMFEPLVLPKEIRRWLRARAAKPGLRRA